MTDQNPNPPRSFKAKHPGQCADGWYHCGGIKVGDIIVRLPVPALFDKAGKRGYYKISFSHLKCYEEAETERLQREEEREARDNVQSRTEPA